MVAKMYPGIVVGVKVGALNGYEWTPVDRQVEAGKIADIPVMIDFGGSTPPLSIEELFMKRLVRVILLRVHFGQLGSRESIVDTNTNKVKPFVFEAQKRGIIFDVGYGGISFAFSQAIPALKDGFYPNSMAPDIHIGSMNNAMKDQTSVMSKFLAMGMKLQDVVKASTWNPATEIKRQDLGHLSPGASTDVAILNVRSGKFGMFDYKGYKIKTTRS